MEHRTSFLLKKNSFLCAAIFMLLLATTVEINAQKKVLDHPDFDIWNSISSKSLSNDGKHIIYTLEKGEKDNFLKLKTTKGKLLLSYDRAERPSFSDDSKTAFFTIKAWNDSITEMKRRKVKKDDMPNDTLAVYTIKNNRLTKIPNVKSYKTPQKWSGTIAYLLEDVKVKKPVKKEEVKDDKKKEVKKTKAKKVSAVNGYHLVLLNTENMQQDTIKYVTSFDFAKEHKSLVYITTGDDDGVEPGVYIKDLAKNNTIQVFNSHPKTKYYQLEFSDSGKNLGFVTDADTTKAFVRPNVLYTWNQTMQEAKKVVDNDSSPKGYRVSSDGRISFSDDETKMYFGLATPAIVKDTTLLPEEIVNVEVWTYDEPTLYTVQEIQVNADKRKSYQAVIHLNQNHKMVQIADETYPNTQLGNKGNAPIALVSNPTPYMLESQWTGNRGSDYAVLNTSTGEKTPLLSKSIDFLRLSPTAKYAYAYNSVDSTWFTINLATKKQVNLTKGKVFYNELSDTPDYAGSYGSAGWTTDDEYLLIYDRYDIWKFNPETGAGERLTNGRGQRTVYRYVRLDNEETNISLKDEWLLTTFNDVTKHSGYYSFNPKRNSGKQLITGPYSYSRPTKAQKADEVLFTRESFEEFPNLRISDLSFKKDLVISDANPQQKDYNWGTAELVHWTSLNGEPLTGMLIKPENFDPNKKYPMLVNFYERSSDGLYSHKAPSPGRSSINYSFYTSRGYVIFNPDIVYRDGYPGESAYNAVIPGVTSLIDKGFINKDKIGAQGHSWGGYQVAHLATKTDIFAAIESGAPVVNMISAYGGIRWDSGLSRQFQYEHTQSRIGGTPWEYPMRYIENSPIYNMDKVNTPILIMHNDADGHVPWYQGIEYFTALRRLGKPTWLLNYNGARHWPLKMQNRKDFNIRMAQFFDYYLKDAPKPVWMERGVPAIEKGINQGYELIKN